MPSLYLSSETLYTSTEINFPFNINVDYSIQETLDTSTSVSLTDLGVYLFLMEVGETVDTQTTIDPLDIDLTIGIEETVETSTEINTFNLGVNYSIQETLTTSTNIDLLISVPLFLTLNYPVLAHNYLPPEVIANLDPVPQRVNTPLELDSFTEIEAFDLATNFFRFISPSRVYGVTNLAATPNVRLGGLDTYFRILELYRSMSNIDDVLENVRNNAESELRSYGIYENQTNAAGEFVDPIFFNDKSLINPNTGRTIAPGTRGYVAAGIDEDTGLPKATQTFSGKDGQFCIYLGPNRR